MPRKIRSRMCFAHFHVMLRGNYKQPIFLDNNDLNYFLSLLEKIVDQYSCKIHLYCLMTNHVHLLIEVGRIPLNRIMQTLSSCYSKYHNHRNDRQGHLFQGRYLAKEVDEEDYLMELCKYIHHNPVKAGMVKFLDEYNWSSHIIYAGKKTQDWLTINKINKLLKKHLPDNINPYDTFINSKEYSHSSSQYCHFDPNNLLIIKEERSGKMCSSEILDFSHISFTRITEIICDHLKIQSEKLTNFTKNRKISLARCLTAYFAHYYAGFTIKQIAEFFFRSPNSISKLMNRNLQCNEEIASLISEIEKKLQKIKP